MFRRLASLAAPLGILLMSLLALLWLQAQRKEPARSVSQRDVVTVRTAVLGELTNQRTIEAYGRVLPRRETTISAEVAGRIVERPDTVRSGRFVQEQTRLLLIDRRLYDARLLERQAAVEQIELDLRQNTLQQRQTTVVKELLAKQLQLAEKELGRIDRLAKRDAAAIADRDKTERLVTQIAIEHARLVHNEELLPTRRARLQAALKEAEAGLTAARLEVERTEIVAPHAGVLTRVEVEQGDLVQPGQALLRLQDPRSVEVRVVLRDDQLYWLWNGDQRPRKGNEDDRRFFEVAPRPVTVMLRLGNRDFHWPAVLNRVEGGQLDPTTQTAACRVLVSEPKRTTADGPPALLKGMAVLVSIPVTTAASFLSIPIEAVQANGQVFVFADGSLQLKQIQPVRFLPDRVVVQSDTTTLKPGDKVVVSPLRTAYDGMEVREGVGN